MAQNKIFLNVPFALEKNINSAIIGWGKCQLSFKLVDNILFKSFIYLLIFYLLNLLIIMRGVLKFPSITVDFSIF